jgi:RNA polymerase sigma-70 factor (ECF subfamily)
MFLHEEEKINPKERSDEDVFLAARTQPYLFSIILDRYQEPFFNKAKSILRSEEDAQDVVQMTFTKIYLHSGRFTPQGAGSFKSWGYKVLMNTTFTQYQKMKRTRGVQLTDELEEILPDVKQMSAAEHKELIDYVGSILNRMPDHLASILGKFFLEDKSQDEIAKEEGISVGAVKTRVYRAKEAFRNALKEVGEGGNL